MGSFETLQDIDQNCRANAANIPRQIITEKDWLGIGFRSSELNFVCPMGQVTEVLSWPEMTALPAEQSWFKGMANVRGRLLPVTDLKGFVTGVSHSETPSSRILIIAFEKGFCGFAVEQVLGIERFFGEEIKPAKSVLTVKEYLPYLQGAFEREHQPWFILNFELMTQTPEFYHVLAARAEIVVG